MSKKIFKHELGHVDILHHGYNKRIEVPRYSEILRVDVQYGLVVVWTIHDTSDEDTTDVLYFSIYGTGHEINDSLCSSFAVEQYLDTVFNADRSLVWHIFWS